ncbi:MAG TPA: glycosyltransferase family 4 protein [Candidatus Eisenbacteria bacterium]|jgi:glycosyltransferase involved in cell wall biosynthesis|nr:glycosyltransferase family 4 protein [Candidatus Eisenbacteria bacterium]
MIPLLVDLEREWRGGQNQFLLLLKGLYELGHAAELLTAKGSSLGHRAEKAGICVHYTSRRWLRFPAARKVRRLISDGRFDLVHVNEAHALSAAWMAGAQLHVPLLISRRVGFPLGSGYFSRARYRAATRIIANSNWVAEQAAASGAPKEKLTVIYEGVEVPPLPTATIRHLDRTRWGIGDQDQLLGCAGVLLEDKGQEWVIRALAQLRGEFPSAKLLLAGEGPDRARLQKLVAELELKDTVMFAGFVKNVESFYRAIDVFVFPALFEGLGTSLLAAMAHGVPSVTYFGCALGEIVEDGKSGLQVEPRNAAALAAALGKILRDDNLAAQMGKAGRCRIEGIFTADRMVEETLRLYCAVCA